MIRVNKLVHVRPVPRRALRHAATLTLCIASLIHGCGTDPPGATQTVAGDADSAPDVSDTSDPDNNADPTIPGEEPLADAESIASATWGVAVRFPVDEADSFLVFGSSFAISESQLVTNAHVVEGAVELFGLLEPDMELVVVQHETQVYCPLDEMYIHPDYETDRFLSTPDVGVLVVDCILPESVPVADDETLYDLALLDDVSLCGFPGDVTFLDLALGSGRPRATCLTGSITGFRPFNLNEATTPQNSSIIQHDVQTSQGTSGSAVFDHFGRVVAINNAATIDPSASNRFAIRIDQVRPFLDEIEGGLVAPVALVPATLGGCPFINDGECDDGRLGAHTNQCNSGTDEADCANVDPTVCQTTNDGECDDGRPGAEFSICAPGTDEADCANLNLRVCPNRAYWNTSYSFGFNPPSGFDGPFVDDSPSASDLFAVDFVFDDLLQIDIGVQTAFGTLDSWIDGWVPIRSNGGDILLLSEDIIMPSGVDATVLEWFSPGSFVDFYWIELWSVHEGLLYQFSALMTPGDFATFGDPIRTSFRSVCID